MMRLGLICAAICSAPWWLQAADTIASPASTGPVVVLKLDDMQAREGPRFANWRRLTAFIDARELKANIGIIGDSLEGDHPEYFGWLKKLAASGRYEFWNHGYDHREWKAEGRSLREFSGSPVVHQRKHLEATQRLAREKLGLVLTAFGAPFNATDASTVMVLKEQPEITVWLYGDAAAASGKWVARRESRLNLETPVSNPNYAAFVRGWESGPVPAVVVLQGHPPYWSDEQFAAFVRIIDFLEERGARFALIAEIPAESGTR